MYKLLPLDGLAVQTASRASVRNRLFVPARAGGLRGASGSSRRGLQPPARPFNRPGRDLADDAVWRALCDGCPIPPC